MILPASYIAIVDTYYSYLAFNLHGQPNKNIGDAFLIVWRIPSRLIRIVNNFEYVVTNQGVLHNFAELALLSFIKVIMGI
jgi:HD-like signal output (HDOD) protein